MAVSSLPMRNWNSSGVCSFRKYPRVSSLPMRNWNNLAGNSKIAAALFPAYLWGIETSLQVAAAAPVLGFQPTYEELKPKKNKTRTPRTISFQPTYEELKRSKIQGTFLLSSVSSLPMRNWNMDSSMFSSPSGRGFQPTYEELKLKSRRSLVISFFSFQPTYEELKRYQWW